MVNQNTLKKQYMKKYYEKNKGKYKEYGQKNREKIKEYLLLKRYGINLLKKEGLLKKQSYICPICLQFLDDDKKNTQMKIVIDHRHTKTKNIRGIIHSRCNIALGLLEDNPTFFINAANYLKQNIFKERKS